MTAYVDLPEFKKPNGRKWYAHMTADSLEELHQFAAQIGVKKHFFHRGSKYPHYDINEDQWIAAKYAGAICISSKELVKVAKSLWVQ